MRVMRVIGGHVVQERNMLPANQTSVLDQGKGDFLQTYPKMKTFA